MLNLKSTLRILPLVLVSAFSTEILAEDLVFEKGQRHSQDIKSDAQRKGQLITALAEIKPGMKVLDVLGGGGYYSEIIASKVTATGKVFLHNNKAYMPYVGKELVARLKDNRLTNVVRFDRETDDLTLDKESLDAIFFVLGYHDLYHVAEGWKIDKDDFIAQLKNALKPGGKLIIIDHSAVIGSGTKHSQDLHRIDASYVKSELQSKGFTLVKESNLLVNKNDNRMISPFKPEIRRKTDRFIHIFQK